MRFSSFVAARYLKPKRTFVSIITVISILGVALGVWLLSVVIAVFTGYGEKLKESVLGAQPHLILNTGGIIENWPETYEAVKEVEGITSVTPFVSGQVVMQVTNERGTFRLAPMIRGILPPEGEELERLNRQIVKAKDRLAPLESEETIPMGEFDVSGFYSAVIGKRLAEMNSLEIGDTILLYSPSDFDAIMDSLNQVETSETEDERREGLAEIRELTAPQEVTVTGIFSSGHWETDANLVYLHLETAQVLFNFDLEECHGISVRTDDGFQADVYKEKLYEILPQQFLILTWMEMNQVFFDAVATERQAMYLILSMIMIVSSFCIMNTMITVTFQKRSEIGLMKALGAREGQIASIFIHQGIFVAFIGVTVGLAVAQVTILFRNKIAGFIGSTFGVEIFSAEAYKVDGGLPAVQSLSDLVIISVGAFLACIIASVIPATIAASLQPAKALRSE